MRKAGPENSRLMAIAVERSALPGLTLFRTNFLARISAWFEDLRTVFFEV
jgi:hypothetical protein